MVRNAIGINPCLLEINERMVTGVAGLLEPPIPFLRGAEGFTGDLPVEQIGLFLFCSVRLDAKVFILFANALHLAQGFVEIVVMQVVQGVKGKDKVKVIVGKWQRGGVANLQTILNFFFSRRTIDSSRWVLSSSFCMATASTAAICFSTSFVYNARSFIGINCNV